MTARIVSIGTAVPATRLHQDEVRALFAAQDGVDRLTRRRIQAVFDASAIAQRHTVLTDLATPPGPRAPGVPAFIDAEGRLLSPTTGTRNDLYIAAAPALSAEAARGALRDARIEPSAVTHVVTVSCTGLFAPGPDYRLVRDLGLNPTVERCHLGFIGCAAALPALRVATALAATICCGSAEARTCSEQSSVQTTSTTASGRVAASAVATRRAGSAAAHPMKPRWQRSTVGLRPRSRTRR